MEDSHSIGTSADTRDDGVRESAFCIDNLCFEFLSDDGLEVSDHHGVGVWPCDGSDDIEGVVDMSNPIAECFIEGVFEGSGTSFYGFDLGSEELHTHDVWLLS